MVTGSDSSYDTRPRDVPAPVAAWITHNPREGFREAERFSINLIEEKLNSHTAKMLEMMDNLVVVKIAAQAEVQSQQGLDRLATLEGVLTLTWQKEIVSMVDETLLSLREEVTRLTEEVTDLRRRNFALETARRPTAPVSPEEAPAPKLSTIPQQTKIYCSPTSPNRLSKPPGSRYLPSGK